ncbi:MAG: protein kinase, partial [Planctomycetes bacterium]|nr:protein kinase [Planctomycetota bacterium]
MIGTTLGPYRIDREIGAGGMGTVWRATAADGTAVAVKVVHPHLVEQPGFRDRFLREAKAGLAITSRNVVRTIECLETDAGGRLVPALVLEFVEGRDLAALLAETGRVPEDLCRHLAREVARGLEAIHAAGIVHRDLKPGNVLMTAAGDVKVMDLGLARQASGEDRMSQTGLFLGTAAYAPPEQFFGKKDLDPRSDLYSLGAMLFELATGRVPFEAEGIGDLVRKVLRDKAPRLGTLAPQTTPFLEELVATLLEKDPDRRFASAAELGETLDAGEAGDWWAAASVRVQMESHRPLRRLRVQRETELWGREEDLAELRSSWESAKAGQGRVVLLEGEAGIGKTRLVEELLAEIESGDDAQILVGRHDPAGAGSAAEALAAAFREHLGAEDLDARLAELLPGTPALVPSFAALLRGDAPPAGAAPLPPSALRTLFADLARALAAEAPLVLVVDDLHFATDEGRALFRAVAAVVAGFPVLLVGTARPGLPARWADDVSRLAHATRHEVRRLDADTVRAALIRHLGGDLAAESVAETIATRAGGNPYFVVEALRLL